MKKRTLRLGSFAMLGVLMFSILGGTIPATAKDGLYSCSGTDAAQEEIDKITKLDFNNVVNLDKWLMDRKSFCVTIDIGTTGRYVVISVPNIQQMLVNSLGGTILESGYAMTRDEPVITAVKAEKTLSEVISTGTPNPMYLGEHPFVVLSLGDMLLEDNIFETITQKISFVFGGSVLSPPSKQDMEASLRYIAPDDYGYQMKSLSAIIKENAETIKGWDEGQCLIEPTKKGKCEFQGSSFLSSQVLDDIVDKSPSEIRKLLGQRVGSKFIEVQWSIAALLGIKGTQIERSMPIDQGNLITADKNLFNGMEDQRVGPRPIASPSYFMGTVILLVSTWFSDWTKSIQSFISWDWVDDSGILNILSTDIVRLILAIIAVLFVWKVMIQLIRTVRDSSSSGAWAGLLGGFLVLMFISWSAISPQTVQNFGKATISLSNTFAEKVAAGMTMESAGSISDICGQEPALECVYMIPHFDTWSRIQFGLPVADDKMKISEANVTLVSNGLPSVDGVSIKNWAYYAQYMMASDDRNVYRALDHFVAPTLNIGSDGKLSKDNPYTNNSTGGEVQGLGGTGTSLLSLLLTIEIWILALFQLMVFLELVFILSMFVLFALRGWSDNQLSQPFKIFGWSLAKNVAYPLFTAIIISTMMAASSRGTVENGVMQFILFAILFLAWKPIKNSGMLPMHQIMQSAAVSNFATRGINTLKYAGSRMIKGRKR